MTAAPAVVTPPLPTAAGTGWDGVTEESETGVNCIDLNRAALAELMQLPGVGRKRAEEILKYRDSGKPFTSIFDLRHVPGIGDSFFRRITGLSPKAHENRANLLRGILGIGAAQPLSPKVIAEAAITLFSATGCLLTNRDGMPLAHIGFSQSEAEHYSALLPQLARKTAPYLRKLEPSTALPCLFLVSLKQPVLFCGNETIILALVFERPAINRKQSRKVSQMVQELAWLFSRRAVVKSTP